MKQFTHREFVKILEKNGFFFSRKKGSHSIYINTEGKHISIPNDIRCVIAHRLIRENNLNIN